MHSETLCAPDWSSTGFCQIVTLWQHGISEAWNREHGASRLSLSSIFTKGMFLETFLGREKLYELSADMSARLPSSGRTRREASE